MSRPTKRHHQAGPPEAGASISLGALTHVGMKRSVNQDSYCALAGSDTPPGIDALLAVADGMGGHQAGDLASKIAIQGLVDDLLIGDEGDSAVPAAGRHDSRLQRVVHQVNAEVHRGASRLETRGMGSTLTAALLADSKAFIAHVGDSRAYLLRKGRLQQLTQDHSWVAEQVAKGVLTPEQAQEHPGRNVLTRALGGAPTVEVDTLAVQLEEGDTLLLCSDGLHSLVTDEEIRRVLTADDPQRACQTLVNLANALGGDDNIAVVIALVQHLKK